MPTLYSHFQTMHLRPILLVAAAFVAGARLAAQEVLIEVVELSNGKPIVGANVSLVDDHGMGLAGNFSDQGGHTVLRAPAPGLYSVRADKIGYESWSSVQLHVLPTQIHVLVGMAVTRNPQLVIPRTEAACQSLSTVGTPAGDLWVEIRKALTASALTEAQGLVPLDVDLYERSLDRNLDVVGQRTEQRSRIARRPAVGISWDQVDSTRRAAVTGGDVYRAPDAATLVSDDFVKSHCYAAIRGYGPEAGLSGLEFKPAKIGSLPELTGVLWMDPKGNMLRSLNFDYVNLPVPLRVARTSGRLEFQQLPGGQWIVPRWYIRLPRVSQVRSTEVGSPVVLRDTLVGFQEAGGTSRPAGTKASSSVAAVVPPVSADSVSPNENVADSAAAAPVPRSLITGIVYDSTTGRGLKDVQVSTGGGKFRTTTNAAGRYALATDVSLTDTLVFEHPRLRLFRISEQMRPVSLPSGAQGEVNLVMPSYKTLRARFCGQNETGTETQGLAAGFVRDAAGNPVANAHVWATWQVLWVQQNGRLVSTNQQRTVETDTGSDGSYLMCGFSRGTKIIGKVGMAGRSTIQENLEIPASLVLEHDFRFGAR
ncbi:MAG: carboxypeptidase regulatory-like domain-containing protein [Gemmatimonadaceae bacterium]